MKLYRTLFVFLLVVSLHSCGQADVKKEVTNKGELVGGSCEGCEAIYECPVPLESLNSVDTLPDFNEPGPKIEISGIIYESDGHTPAPNVVLYVYHTDQKGVYPKKGDEKGWGKRHGSIRGWMKTDEKGSYKFYTLVPGSYPNSNNPKHIHPTIKEGDKNEYYVDEFLFDDDPYLTAIEKQSPAPRGGSGILKPYQKDGILRATRNIILGLNIPGYPEPKKVAIQSGLKVGANCPAFEPLHLSGIDKGKSVCPMCKYGYGQGVMVWFNHDNVDELKNFTARLEKEMQTRGEKKLRVFMVFMNPSYKVTNARDENLIKEKIKNWCQEQKVENVAMVWVPSPVDEETSSVFNINPIAKNTVFVYKQRRVHAKWVNMNYDEAAINEMLKTLDTPS